MKIYTQNINNQTHLIYEDRGIIIEQAKLLKLYHTAKGAIRNSTPELIVRSIPGAPELYGVWEPTIV